ncbi:SDR family oxidoreductase [Lysobacter sp. MMG2]|nr:SDR family oxidoreductase [Lysobacter sp. MMG2]
MTLRGPYVRYGSEADISSPAACRPGRTSGIGQSGHSGRLRLLVQRMERNVPPSTRTAAPFDGRRMVEAIMDDDALLEKAWDRIPLRRAGRPEEIASAVAFLASDEAAWITGIVLPVDGGQTCTDGGPEWGK